MNTDNSLRPNALARTVLRLRLSIRRPPRARGPERPARPDAHAHDEFAPVDQQRHLERPHNPQSGQPDVLDARGVFNDHRKFIASQSCRKPDSLRRPLQALRKAHEYPIAESMPHAVVDVFEVVDIEEQYTDRVVRPSLLESAALSSANSSRRFGSAVKGSCSANSLS